jgi:hypothetical protein
VTPVVGVAVALAGVVGRAKHSEVCKVEREVGARPAALNVIDVQVLAGRKLVLVAAAQFAPTIVGAKHVVADPPPLRGLQKGRRGDEPRRPAMCVSLSSQKPDEEGETEEQERSRQDLFDHIRATIPLTACPGSEHLHVEALAHGPGEDVFLLLVDLSRLGIELLDALHG